LTKLAYALRVGVDGNTAVSATATLCVASPHVVVTPPGRSYAIDCLFVCLSFCLWAG